MDRKRKHFIRNLLALLLVLFLFAEISIRVVFALKDYPVGKVVPTWMAFNPVDSLELHQSCFTDAQGIYRLKKEVWERFGQRINADYLRGREFVADTLRDSATSILFIGDSFVWGAHATPIDSCFADLLDRDEKFVCYNAGVPGTDPAQYAAMASRYVPQLRPDITIVCVYLANDLMSAPRAIVPHEELWYQTNAGWLPASYKELRFHSARESYNYIMHKYSVHSRWEKALLKTALGTAILSLPLRLEEYAEWSRKRKSPVANSYLKQIKSLCTQWNSRLLIVIIPAVQTDLKKDFFEDAAAYVQRQYPALMGGLENECIVLPVKKEMYYPLPDGHLNNKGHVFTANYIRSTLLASTPP